METLRTSCVALLAAGSLTLGYGKDDGPDVDGARDGGGPREERAGRPAVDPPAGLWVRSIEGVGDEGVSAISPRADGSFVVLGAYEGPGTFSPKQPDERVLAMPDGEREDVLARYAPDGALRSLQADPLGGGSGRVRMADDGSLYVTGTGGFTAGGLEVPDDADVFVAMYGPDGTPRWASSASGAAGMGAGTAVDVWRDGGVVIGGTYKGTITFAAGEPAETRLASTSEEVFLARYDASGALRWAKRAIAAPYVPEWRLAAAPDGGIFLYGALENDTTFNPDLADQTELHGGNIGFVVKLDDAGNVKWARALSQAEGYNGVSALAAFEDGEVVVIGSFVRVLTLGPGEVNETMLAAVGSDFPGRMQFPDFFAARFDAKGRLLWARREGGEVWDGAGQAIALDDGATLITGGYTNRVTFAEGEPAEATLSTASNDMTAFLAVLEADGSTRWVRQGLDGQVAPLADGGVAVAGAFMGTLTLFADEPGEQTLASAGGWDVYVARLGWADAAR